MKVNKIDNTNFGIKLIKSENWNKDVYNSFVNSKLVKEIDIKYPDASANYFLYKENGRADDEPRHTILFDINLAKDKIWHFWLNSNSKEKLVQYLSNNIKELSLEKIEADITKGGKIYTPIKIGDNIPETNPIKKFFKRIFS